MAVKDLWVAYSPKKKEWGVYRTLTKKTAARISGPHPSKAYACIAKERLEKEFKND